MKKKKLFALGAAAAAFALAISCATQPKTAAAQEPTPAGKPEVAAGASAAKAEPAVAAPDELRAKAADLRKKAFDLGLKEILPDEYAAADKAFAAGGAEYGKDNAAAAASYTDAATRFKDVIDRGLPLLAASERKKAEGLRDKAVAGRAGELFPRPFAYAEGELAKPRRSEAAGDFEPAVVGYRASSREYEVLYKLCDAANGREYIASRDLAKWDTANWNLAETKFKASQDLFESDAKAAGDSVDEAILRYGLARANAFEYYASDRKKASETEMARASGIKSEVAVKDEYAAALDLEAKAETAQAAKDFESSSSLYDRAATAFAAAHAHAKSKMDTAKGELESLDAAIAAKNAEAIPLK
jgi:hypothetical protein